VQAAYETAIRALPDMHVAAVIYPGNPFGSPHHYLLWGHGKTPLAERLFSPVLVDARTGDLTAVVQMPLYLRALEISRPLHFGDYGGLPLKIIWALDERIVFTAGVRYQQIKVNVFNPDGSISQAYDEQAVTPAFGLVVKPIDRMALYANYIQGLQ